MKLYYLTSAPYALAAIALRRLKVSRFADLNDPFELLAVDVSDAVHRAAFEDIKTELNKSKGLICFSANWSNPVLWGHYADKHTGVALGFEIADRLPVQAIYSKEPIKIPIDPASGKLVLDQPQRDQLIRTKFWDWNYEDEWRIFVGLDHSTIENGMYFISFSPEMRLAEVILGPRCTLPVPSLQPLIDGLATDIVIRLTQIETQSFRVVAR